MCGAGDLARHGGMTTSSTIWGAATARADRAPGDLLPCPGCGGQVKGANLRSHAERLHPVDRRAAAAIVGVDRRIHRAYGVAAALGLVVVGGLLAAFPDRSLPPDTRPEDALTAIGRSPALVAIAGGVALLALGVIVHRALPPRARLTVVDGTVTLRHRRGTGTRRVTGRLEVETGSLVRRVPSGVTGTAGGDSTFPADDAHAGTYLRITGRQRSITVGCTSSTRVRAHWSGWTAGSRRRWWDLTVTPADFVALQYALAAAGVFRAGGR